jgi:FixJ family two-component response regulator
MNLGEVFIVEDDQGVRETLSILLTSAGYQAVCFSNGDALLKHARKRYPVCILLDVRLPGKSGLDILDELRRDDYPAPILLISGYADIETALQAGKSGAADFIEKPFQPSELLRRIKVAIENATPNRSGIIPQGRASYLPGWEVLTPRQQDILQQMLLGKTSKEIALHLNLSPRTVEDHRSNIIKKANAKTTSQLLLAVFGAI